MSQHPVDGTTAATISHCSHSFCRTVESVRCPRSRKSALQGDLGLASDLSDVAGNPLLLRNYLRLALYKARGSQLSGLPVAGRLVLLAKLRLCRSRVMA